MLKKIDSFFAGAELGKANIRNAEMLIKKLSEYSQNSVFLQLFDSRAISSTEQFFFAARHATNAVSEGNSFSNRLEIELLLRITATRQIGKALEIAGIKDGVQQIAIAGLSKDKKALESLVTSL